MLSAVPRPVTVRVPAKINLHLAVGGVRPDGFHDLVTVFHAVSLFDEVSVEPAEEPALDVHGDGVAEVPLDATNLAWRAVELLAPRAGRQRPTSWKSSSTGAPATWVSRQTRSAGATS